LEAGGVVGLVKGVASRLEEESRMEDRGETRDEDEVSQVTESSGINN
jgi:hypothetical protein